jgi:SAM-dependent methyltransferase
MGSSLRGDMKQHSTILNGCQPPIVLDMTEDRTPFPQGFFARDDESEDTAFYADPRMVVHIDEAAIAACRELYTELLPPSGRVLDLMSSWRSHLPEDYPGTVVGLGLNADEMAENPQLSEFVVHDLNAEPTLPFADSSFDAVVCSVSVQYMTRPLDTFREVQRTLNAGAPFVITFSNRCFPTKAIAAWRSLGDEDHKRLVSLYFVRSGGWTEISAQTRLSGVPGISDPLYAVWAFRDQAG